MQNADQEVAIVGPKDSFTESLRTEYSVDPQENQGYKVKSDSEADWNEKQNGLCIDVY